MSPRASGGGGGRRGGQGAGGVKGGRVNPPKAGKGRGGPNQKFVSGSSQLIASSVSLGLAISVGVKATCKRSARSPSGLGLTPPPPVVGTSVVPLALKARGDFPFNHIVKVSEIELLERFEGGG